MLIRCETCQKLYPEHHGNCKSCASGGATSSAPSRKLSLKERLNASGPPLRKPEQTKERVSSMFQKQTAPPPAEDIPAAPIETPEELDLELEESALPKAPDSSINQTTDTWTPENGGVCVECRNYNPAHNAFCYSCETMLQKTNRNIEHVTAYDLSEIPGVINTFIDKLKKLKVATTEDLLKVGCNRSNRQRLSKNTGMSERSLLKLVHSSDLCRIPSMKPEHIGMLTLIGINTKDELLALKPSVVYRKLEQNRMKINQQGIMFFPTKTNIKSWFQEGRALTTLNIQP